MKRVAIRIGCLFSLSFFAACGATPPATPAVVAAPPPVGEPAPAGRLPSAIHPTHYDLRLHILPDQERFEGEVAIDIETTTRRDLIWVHAAAMNVSHVHVSREGQADIAARFEGGGNDGVSAVHLSEAIEPGPATLHFVYDAPFDHSLRGLYRVDSGGESYAFTQFESISARLAFPCFDEPAFKTPFDVTLFVKSEHTAVSNTRVLEETPMAGGLKRVRFATTEPLPTYLVAFAVGNLDVVNAPAIPPSGVRTRPIPFRGVAVHGRGGDLAYALEHTPAIVQELERYFGIEYPYDKLDIIAVPDFAAGAMENAGAITFREPLLLVDRATASEDQYRGVNSVVAHELAHQWFGNLVTMPWWDDIWLNEAFATWMASHTMNNLHPEYAEQLSFRRRSFEVMGSDSLPSARQIRQPIESNHDILNAFDGITYSKGGAVIAMFERFVGEGTFQRGIHAYLEAHRFGSATSEDFLHTISEVSGRDITEPFRTFLNQPGVPLVSVELSCEPDSRRIIARQSRYMPVGATAPGAQLWQIPFCVHYEVNHEPHDACAMLNHEEEHLSIPEATCPSWIMPNTGAMGYYRFAMTSTDLRNLRERGWSHLSPPERLAVVDSLRAGFGANTVAPADLFNTFSVLVADSTREVVTAPMGVLYGVREWMADEAGRNRVEAFARRLYTAQYNRLGWETGRRDDSQTQLLRSSVISFMAINARLPAARREALRRGRAILASLQNPPTPDATHTPTELISVALQVLVEEGDVEVWEALLALFKASDDAITRGRILSALSSTRDPALSDRALALTLDPALRVNEALSPLSGQIGQLETRDRAWAWMQAHLEEIVGRVSATGASYLPWYASSFCDEEHAAQVEGFFASRIEGISGGPRNLRGALENIRICAAKKTALIERVNAFFQAQHP